jgi:hypothetical protein
MQFSKTTVSPFTQLELFSHGLKSMKVNFNIFPGPDFNIIEPFWSVFETRLRNRFPPPASPKKLDDTLQEEWYKIPLEAVQNLYESISRGTATVLKAKGGPNPY